MWLLVWFNSSWVFGLRASVLLSMLIRVLPQFFARWVSPTGYLLHERMQAMNALEDLDGSGGEGGGRGDRDGEHM